MNMKSFNLACAVIVTAMAASCAPKAGVKGVLTGASDRDIVVRMLDVNRMETLDTVRTDANGRFSCDIPMQKGQPEFIYLFYGDTKVASLLLEAGDKVELSADTLGKYSVTGSSETDKLMQVERDEEEFTNLFASISARIADLDPASPKVAELQKTLTKSYIDYYRSRVSYVMKNSHSLTVIPVLYQNIAGALPVFGNATDALHFRTAADSLRAVYPESRYVKALEEEAVRRQNVMSISSRIASAPVLGYMDVEMPDVTGKKVKLSELEGKLVMLWFWNCADASQKLFNQEVLKPLYEEYHSKGFEIYSVNIDSDKGAWASVVRNQGLSWVNVCDGLGAASPALTLYNVASLPTSFFIIDGEMVRPENVGDAASLRKYVASTLK